jgi:hypothetical protein
MRLDESKPLVTESWLPCFRAVPAQDVSIGLERSLDVALRHRDGPVIVAFVPVVQDDLGTRWPIDA